MTQESGDMLTLGQRLKNAREALNLSIEDVAAQTTLKQSHIEYLEKDIFILSAIPPMFVRGYVRTYLRFLNLPETWLNEADYGESCQVSTTNQKSLLKVTNPKSQARWLKLLTWLVLLSAVSMSVAWWWQEHQKDLNSKEHILSTSTENRQESSIVSTNLTESSTSEVKSPETSHSEPAQTSETNAETKNSVITTEKAEIPSASSGQPVQAVSSTENMTKVEGSQVNSTIPNSETQNLTGKENLTTASEPTPPITDELHIIIHTDQSWIAVSNSKKRQLAQKLYNAGEVIKLNNHGEYSLTIGAPANVKIYYKGQEVPLKIDGRIAKIRLPLPQ